MGSCIGRVIAMPKYPTDDETNAVITRYNLKKQHVQRLYNIFRKYSDINDVVVRETLPIMLKEKKNIFLKHLIEYIIEIDPNTKVNFAKFLEIISCFSCYSEKDMIKFTFDTFDLDKNGTLSSSEFELFLNSIQEHTADFPDEIEKALSYFNKDCRIYSSMTFFHFKKLNRRFPHMLWPVCRLQYRIQEHTLGYTEWKRYQSRLHHPNKYRPYNLLICCFCFSQKMNKDDSNLELESEDSDLETKSNLGHTRNMKKRTKENFENQRCNGWVDSPTREKENIINEKSSKTKKEKENEIFRKHKYTRSNTWHYSKAPINKDRTLLPITNDGPPIQRSATLPMHRYVDLNSQDKKNLHSKSRNHLFKARRSTTMTHISHRSGSTSIPHVGSQESQASVVSKLRHQKLYKSSDSHIERHKLRHQKLNKSSDSHIERHKSRPKRDHQKSMPQYERKKSRPNQEFQESRPSHERLNSRLNRPTHDCKHTSPIHDYKHHRPSHDHKHSRMSHMHRDTTQRRLSHVRRESTQRKLSHGHRQSKSLYERRKSRPNYERKKSRVTYERQKSRANLERRQNKPMSRPVQEYDSSSEQSLFTPTHKYSVSAI